jgi:signal transduction histidine kinase
MLGKTVFEIAPRELAEAYRVKDEALLQAGGSQQYESQVCNTRGEYRDVYFQKAVFRDDRGAVNGLIGTVLDITDRKKAERERRELEAQLRQAQKMEALGQLAGGVAHDFNNMLFAMLANVEVLEARSRQGVLGSSELHETLGQVKHIIDKAADLTKQLLAFGRRQPARRKRVDVGTLVADQVKMIRRTVSENIEIQTHVDPELRPVWADATQLSQVFTNLVVNARDAMAEGGQLTIEADNVDLSASSAGSDLPVKPGPYVCLRVRDTGHGIDEQTRRRMFEPFFTTKPVGSGTGLGLSVAYGIVQEAGGCISVDSSPGEGTTVSVLLPAAEPEESAPPEPQPALETVSGEQTILVCEDEEIVRKPMCEILRASGFQVIEAESAEHAIEVMAGYEGSVDLLITDVIMPGMNGPELVQALREQHPTLPVLYMSGYAPDEMAARIGVEKRARFAEKPCRPSKLLQHVSDILKLG